MNCTMDFQPKKKERKKEKKRKKKKKKERKRKKNVNQATKSLNLQLHHLVQQTRIRQSLVNKCAIKLLNTLNVIK